MPGGGVIANDAGDVLVATRSCSLEDQDRWTIPSWTRSAVRRPRCSSTSWSRSRAVGSPDVSSSSAARSSACRWPRSAPSSRPAAARTTSPSASSAGGERARLDRRAGAPRPARRPPAARSAIACQRPAGPLDPVAMIDLASYGLTAQSFEFLCTLAPNATDIAPGPRRELDPERRQQRLDVQAPLGRQVAGRQGLHARPTSSPRWIASSPPGNSGIKGVLDKGSAVATDPTDRDDEPRQRQRQLPVPRLGLQRPVADHPGRLCRRARRSTRRRTGPVPGRSSKAATTSRRASSSSATTRGGAARPRSTARSSPSSMTRPRWSPPTRAARSTPSSSSTSCRAPRSSTTRTSPSSIRRPPTTARSGCTRTRATFADPKVRQAFALSIDRPALIQQLFKGKGVPANDHVIWQFYPYFSDTVTQRAQDIAKAKQLLADAGKPAVSATLQYGRLNEIPDLAVADPEPGRRSGVHDHPGRPGQRPVLRRAVVQHDQADRPAVHGQRRVRHRRLRPPGEPGRLPQLGLQDARRLERVALFEPGVRCGVHRIPVCGRRRRPEGGVREDRADQRRRHADRDPVLLQLPVRQLEEVHRRVHLRARSDVRVGRLDRLVPSHGSVRWPDAPVPRPTSQDGDVARWPATSRAGSCWRS